ncbi:hypothetical protein C1141_06845 [Vibrio agarivorans]|nr:hypothetical protein C1141_06845 [Vibrio agarivorans]
MAFKGGNKNFLRITNYELRITNYELRITNYELRITNYHLFVSLLRQAILYSVSAALRIRYSNQKNHLLRDGVFLIWFD